VAHGNLAAGAVAYARSTMGCKTNRLRHLQSNCMASAYQRPLRPGRSGRCVPP